MMHLKWLLIFLLLGAATVLASPFIMLSLAFNEWKTKIFLNETGKAFGRACSIDLRGKNHG